MADAIAKPEFSYDLDATQVARYILTLDAARPKPDVTQLKLQKLLYLAQANYLASTGHRLFSASVEAFDNGPVVYRVLKAYSAFADSVIAPASTECNFTTVPRDARDAVHLAARAVDHTFWLTPAHSSEPGVWYAGTSPQGLFRSADGGDTWAPFSCINDDPQYRKWFGTVQDGTPDGPKLHSLIVDPRDPKHLYFAISGGGVHESCDGGATFAPLVDGMEVVTGFDPGDVSFHDPHCVRLCPGNPDRLYQQNHCGIYRLDRPGRRWERIGRNLPALAGLP